MAFGTPRGLHMMNTLARRPFSCFKHFSRVWTTVFSPYTMEIAQVKVQKIVGCNYRDFLTFVKWEVKSFLKQQLPPVFELVIMSYWLAGVKVNHGWKEQAQPPSHTQEDGSIEGHGRWGCNLQSVQPINISLAQVFRIKSKQSWCFTLPNVMQFALKSGMAGSSLRDLEKVIMARVIVHAKYNHFKIFLSQLEVKFVRIW